jgi:hypothetical protein
VFEKSIAKATDWSGGLNARSEDPFKQCLNPGWSLSNGNLHATWRGRVRVFDSRAFAKRPRRQILGERSIGGTKSSGVVGNRLGSKFGGMAIPAGLWPGK